jgi:hypothetical protein
MYVAASRPKWRLHLVWAAGSSNGFKPATAGRSRFLEPLRSPEFADCIEEITFPPDYVPPADSDEGPVAEM